MQTVFVSKTLKANTKAAAILFDGLIKILGKEGFLERGGNLKHRNYFYALHSFKTSASE